MSDSTQHAEDVRTHEWYLELIEVLGEAIREMLNHPLGGYEQSDAYIKARSQGHYAFGRYEVARDFLTGHSDGGESGE